MSIPTLISHNLHCVSKVGSRIPKIKFSAQFLLVLQHSKNNQPSHISSQQQTMQKCPIQCFAGLSRNRPGPTTAAELHTSQCHVMREQFLHPTVINTQHSKRARHSGRKEAPFYLHTRALIFTGTACKIFTQATPTHSNK